MKLLLLGFLVFFVPGLAHSDTLEVVKRLEFPPIPFTLPAAVQHVQDTPGHWWRFAWLTKSEAKMWNRDTVCVEIKGDTLRAQEQFAITEDFRMVRLVGLVPTGDLHRRRDGAVEVWVRFPQDLDPKQVLAVRARPPVKAAR